MDEKTLKENLKLAAQGVSLQKKTYKENTRQAKYPEPLAVKYMTDEDYNKFCMILPVRESITNKEKAFFINHKHLLSKEYRDFVNVWIDTLINNKSIQETEDTNKIKSYHELMVKEYEFPSKQNTETPEPPKHKITAKHYTLSIIFDCHAIGKALPEGKKEWESEGYKKTKKVKPNTIYKNRNIINCNIDLNKENDLIKNFGEHWKDIILSLSDNTEVLKQYLQKKQL